MLHILDQNPTLHFLSDLLHNHPQAEVYVVGGAVRDALRGIAASDVDVVIAKLPAEGLEQWLSAHGSVDYVGKRFGIWKFRPGPNPKGSRVDIALPRTERPSDASGARRAFEIQSDPDLPIEKDLARRDFTINALAYRWKTRELIDPFSGKKDLHARLIQTVGEPGARFSEDASRLLRAIRFACVVDGTIEGRTWETLQAFVPRLSQRTPDGAWVVAREVAGSEFFKALEANAKLALDLYQTSGAWNMLFSPLQFPKRTRECLNEPIQATQVILLLCLECFSHADAATRWLSTWAIPIDHRLVRAAFLYAKNTVEDLSSAAIERQILPWAEILLPVLLCRDDLAHAKRLQDVHMQTCHAPLLRGEDLRNLGWKPGPHFAQTIDQIRSAQLDGLVRTKEEALRLLPPVIS